MSKLTMRVILILSCLALIVLVAFIAVATQFNLLIVIPAAVSAAYLAFLLYTTIPPWSELSQ